MYTSKSGEDETNNNENPNVYMHNSENNTIVIKYILHLTFLLRFSIIYY